MTWDLQPEPNPSEPVGARRGRRDVPAAQETIYAHLLSIVKGNPPEDTLRDFRQLFIEEGSIETAEITRALSMILVDGDRQVFVYTLKRSCYILINNWGAARHHHEIQELVKAFEDPILQSFAHSKMLQRLRSWVFEFAQSEDYKDLKLFASRFDEGKKTWSQRYTSYLLASQYYDHTAPEEQREAARTLSRQLRDRFRFDLAMYVAHSQMNPRASQKLLRANPSTRQAVQNPTSLGEDVLRLIKMIVLRRGQGQFSYENLARIFSEQTEGLSYRSYKNSLLRYLLFSVDNPGFVRTIQQKLSKRLDELYPEQDGVLTNDLLKLRTSSRVLEFLTTETKTEPSPLFSLLISQGGPLTLVMVLLKLVLISPTTRNVLELRVAHLIRFYEQLPHEDCAWFIQFLEVLSVTFAIYVEDVRYDVVRMRSKGSAVSSLTPEEAIALSKQAQSLDLDQLDLEEYQIFSQCRGTLAQKWMDTAKQLKQDGKAEGKPEEH